jgi:D-psicose/D-tagatose/L-ribulose 3-epimerase
MKYGVNLLLFGDTVSGGVLRRFPQIRRMGFDGVEVPVFAPAAVDVERIRAVAERNGLGVTVSGALPPGSRLYGRRAGPRRAAERYLRQTLRVTAALGAPVVCGPLYKVVGDTDESLPLAQQRRETIRVLRPIMKEAEELGVSVAFEPLNRFETNLVTTVAQGIELCRRLRSRSAGLLLDTFHMHIEEKDTAAAVRAAARAGVIAHFHASENDRGIAGSGQVHWDRIAPAVRGARYNRWVVLESFSQRVQAIRTAVSCWRSFYPSEEAFMKQGLRFVRRAFGR